MRLFDAKDLPGLGLGEAPRLDDLVDLQRQADESFGETIGAYWDKGRRSATTTRAPERIEALLSMTFGASARPDTDPWRALRYQLLTAVTGTAIEAARRQAAAAAVIVHEFRTDTADAENVAGNTEDFQSFVGVLFDQAVVDWRQRGK